MIIFLSSCSNDSNIYDNLEIETEMAVETNYADITLKDAENIINNDEIEFAGGGPMELLKRDFFEKDNENEFYKKYNKCTDFTQTVGEDIGSDLISQTYLYLKEPDFDKKEKFRMAVLLKQRTFTSNEDNLKLLKKVDSKKECLIEPFSLILKDIAKNFNSKLDKTSVNLIELTDEKSNLLLKFSSKLDNFKESRVSESADINFYYLLVDEKDYFSEYYLVLINNDDDKINIENLIKIADKKKLKSF